MSFETWKEEFYPIPAHDVPKEEALAHSLQKWIGLKPENLEKHKVVIFKVGRFKGVGTSLKNPYLEIDGDSCALCRHHENEDRNCPTCPLSKVNGISCSNGRNGWQSFTDTNSPDRMILELQRAVQWVNSSSAG